MDWKERARAIEREDLIDLSEWSEVSGRSLPVWQHLAFSSELWDVLERVPLRLRHETTLDDRVWHVIGRVQIALERYLKRDAAHGAARPFCVHFGARIPCRDPSHDWVVLRLEGELCGDAFVLTVSLHKSATIVPSPLASRR